MSPIQFAAIMECQHGNGGVTPPYASILYLGARIGHVKFSEVVGPAMMLIFFGYLPVVILTSFWSELSLLSANTIWLPFIRILDMKLTGMFITSVFTRKQTRMKAIQAALITSALLGTVPVSAVTLRISHVRPQGTAVDNDVKRMGKELENATKGDVKLRIYAANALGDYTVVQERISIGSN
ncbi:hypothetical protein P4S72_21835 [Vibrio sp. PP-XX7]